MSVKPSLAKSNGDEISEAELSEVTAFIDNKEFGTILVQLRALGLIQQSERKRGVNDNGRYWALTPYGETRAIQLRAVKKGDSGSSNLASATVGELAEPISGTTS